MNNGSVFAYLHVIPSAGAEHTVPISQFPFCIGRAEHNELALAEERISRHHACLRLEGDQIQLVDLGSENGTWRRIRRFQRIHRSQLTRRSPRAHLCQRSRRRRAHPYRRAHFPRRPRLCPQAHSRQRRLPRRSLPIGAENISPTLTCRARRSSSAMTRISISIGGVVRAIHSCRLIISPCAGRARSILTAACIASRFRVMMGCASLSKTS